MEFYFMFYLLLFLVIIPVSVLIHEIGHGLAVVLFSKMHTRVYLGPTENNHENFQIGRMHFHIMWAFYGYCALGDRESDPTKTQRVINSLAGPLATLLVLLLTIMFKQYVTSEQLDRILTGVFIYNSYLFLCTIIPFRYPKWWRPYGGMPSDGYRVYLALKKSA
ncbi:hypothetical protein FIU87_02290 [Bacillus sp. THAF10]|uniref:site-2 protease family protein n=1 Tax=Bacillus sp. THAF10 TaxID=2587848 RepID=UPI0012683F70|nr:site-2 protease family protein [Bacillus sp. THAF10]QFT87468.1 hypothetical protein FIU87_02290 [Bacillus sp. THAF10]